MRVGVTGRRVCGHRLAAEFERVAVVEFADHVDALLGVRLDGEVGVPLAVGHAEPGEQSRHLLAGPPEVAGVVVENLDSTGGDDVREVGQRVDGLTAADVVDVRVGVEYPFDARERAGLDGLAHGVTGDGRDVAGVDEGVADAEDVHSAVERLLELEALVLHSSRTPVRALDAGSRRLAGDERREAVQVEDVSRRPQRQQFAHTHLR